MTQSVRLRSLQYDKGTALIIFDSISKQDSVDSPLIIVYIYSELDRK